MNRRDIVIGVVILAVLAGVIYWRQLQTPQENISEAPETLSVEDALENKFNIQLPDDVEKAELVDVSGGTGSAVATRKFENGTFTHSLLADLPDPESGTYYSGWLVRGQEGDTDYGIVSTGSLVMAKGGWSLEYTSGVDYTDFTRVLVSREQVNDNTPETRVLEGSF